MRTKTLIFGGSFDMPHVGHRAAAVEALSYMSKYWGYEELWFLPSNIKSGKEMVAAHHRIAMLECLISEMNDNRFRICTDEAEMTDGAGIYAVVKRMVKNYPSRKLCYVGATDFAEKIRRWRNSRKLVMTIPFTIINREGVYNWSDSGWFYKKPHVYIAKKPTSLPVSSTDVRTDFKTNWNSWVEKQHKSLSDGVQDYIIEHKLYK